MSNIANSNLRNRVLHAGSWIMAAYVISQFLRLGGNLILTRLLAPEMFGIMALASVILMGLNLFTDVGLLQNVVQSRRGDDPRYLNVAWVIQIARGILLSIITLIISWSLSLFVNKGIFPASSVYADPVLPSVITVFAILPLISGFNSTKLLVANRKLQLGIVASLELLSQALGLLAMVVWAFYEKTIWALVIGSIVTNTSKMFLSHTLPNGPANRFEWDQNAFNEIFHFGKWIMISSVLGFLVLQGDKLLLGSMVQAETMGIYSIAFFLANATKEALMKLGSSVFYPALSEVARGDPHKLSSVYYKIRYYVDGITFFLTGFLIITGNTIVQFLYDERYIDAGWMLQILSISLVSVGFVIAGQVCMALGHVKVISILAGIRVILLYISIPLLFTFFGLQGAVVAIAISPMFTILGYMWFLKKYKLLNTRKEFIMFPVILIGVAVGIVFNYCFEALSIIE